MYLTYTTRPEVAFRLVTRRVPQIVVGRASDLDFDFTWTSPFTHYVRYESRPLVEFLEAHSGIARVRVAYTATSQDKFANTASYVLNEVLGDRVRDFLLRVAPLAATEHVLPFYPLEIFSLRGKFAMLFWSTDETELTPTFYFSEERSGNAPERIAAIYDEFWARIPEGLHGADGEVHSDSEAATIMARVSDNARKLFQLANHTSRDVRPVYENLILTTQWRAHLHYVKASDHYSRQDFWGSVGRLCDLRGHLPGLLKVTLFGNPANDIEEATPRLLEALGQSNCEAKVIIGVGSADDIEAAASLLSQMHDFLDGTHKLQIALVPMHLFRGERPVAIADLVVLEGAGGGIVVSADGDARPFFAATSQNHAVEHSLDRSFEKLWRRHRADHLVSDRGEASTTLERVKRIVQRFSRLDFRTD
ncbi:MAG TPA: hypothetical protein VNA25_04385 [Phycisphaerae bacterium]|nr:hypothetical protein [Phycisphaerae bacterium]